MNLKCDQCRHVRNCKQTIYKSVSPICSQLMYPPLSVTLQLHRFLPPPSDNIVYSSVSLIEIGWMVGWGKFGEILPTFLFIMTIKGLPVGVVVIPIFEITNLFSIPVKICCAVLCKRECFLFFYSIDQRSVNYMCRANSWILSSIYGI